MATGKWSFSSVSSHVHLKSCPSLQHLLTQLAFPIASMTNTCEHGQLALDFEQGFTSGSRAIFHMGLASMIGVAELHGTLFLPLSRLV